MPLIDILEKINKETADRVGKLEQEYNDKKKRLEADYNAKEKKIDEDMHLKVEENSKKIIEKAENLAEREAKNQLLEAKRKLIEEILEKAVEELSKSDDYEQIITDMLKKSDIKDDNTVVIPAKGKEEKTKAAIQNSGKGYFLSDKSSDIKGGFIIKTEKMEIDNSFETIIKKQLLDELEIKLHKTLFQ